MILERGNRSKKKKRGGSCTIDDTMWKGNKAVSIETMSSSWSTWTGGWQKAFSQTMAGIHQTACRHSPAPHPHRRKIRHLVEDDSGE